MALLQVNYCFWLHWFVQEEERRLRDEHIAYQQQEAQLARTRQQDILLKEEKAKLQGEFEEMKYSGEARLSR